MLRESRPRRRRATSVATLLAVLLAAPSASLAATYLVTRESDTSDGVCNADCSLREAVTAANASVGVPDTILVPAGHYLLTIAPQGPGATTGDLDLTDDVEIRAAGAGPVVIDAGGIDRVFNVYSFAVEARLVDLVLTGGAAQSGGALLVEADVTLERVVVVGNTASERGGGVDVREGGVLTVLDSTLAWNLAGTRGGGIHLRGSSARVERSTLSGNGAPEGGALFLILGADALLLNTTVSGNGDGPGAVLHSWHVAEPSFLWLEHVTVTDSSALAVAGARDVVLRNSIVEGGCDARVATLGGNVESGGDSCGLDDPTDRPGVDAALGPLAENGGPTRTHLPAVGSPAIGAAVGCPPPATDQRGEPRDVGSCDSGAVERQPDEGVAIFSSDFEGGTLADWSELVPG